MANYTNIIPFILQAEGGYNADDDGQGPVNKGVLWSTWQAVFGNTWQRFIDMAQADWGTIFKSRYWDAIGGDQIQDQAIADFLADWYWQSINYAIGRRLGGTYYGVQPVLNAMGAQVSVDGQMGPQTLAAINAADPTALLNALRQNRNDFYNALVAQNPTQGLYLAGWLNRLNNLYSTVSAYVGDVATAISTNPGKSTVVALFFCLPWP